MTDIEAKLTITLWKDGIYCTQIHLPQKVYTSHTMAPSAAVDYLRRRLKEIYESYDPIVSVYRDSTYPGPRVDKFDINDDTDTIRFIMSH